MQCDLVTLKQVKILSKPEKYGSRVGFQISSHEGGSLTVYIGAYQRRKLAAQITKHRGELVDIEIYRVPWIMRKETETKSGTMFYLMQIKES